MRHELRRVSSILWAPRPVAMIRSAYMFQQIVVYRSGAVAPQRLPLGEAGTTIGSSEPIVVTDEEWRNVSILFAKMVKGLGSNIFCYAS